MKIEHFRLEEVELMPSALQPGVLYASQKYRTAAHLCACGCGEKVRTQLGQLGWRLTKGRAGPTLNPSIGNWQKPCRSHYYIRNGRVLWMEDWTDQEVHQGRRAEERRLDADFKRHRGRWWGQLKDWLKWRS
jgi:hypothetical protein